jgi:hypothetical protein
MGLAVCAGVSPLLKTICCLHYYHDEAAFGFVTEGECFLEEHRFNADGVLGFWMEDSKSVGHCGFDEMPNQWKHLNLSAHIGPANGKEVVSRSVKNC